MPSIFRRCHSPFRLDEKWKSFWISQNALYSRNMHRMCIALYITDNEKAYTAIGVQRALGENEMESCETITKNGRDLIPWDPPLCILFDFFNWVWSFDYAACVCVYMCVHSTFSICSVFTFGLSATVFIPVQWIPFRIEMNQMERKGKPKIMLKIHERIVDSGLFQWIYCIFIIIISKHSASTSKHELQFPNIQKREKIHSYNIKWYSFFKKKWFHFSGKKQKKSFCGFTCL